jgi:hypothetical protein
MNDDPRADDELEEALRSLGSSLEIPTPADYPERVLRRLALEAQGSPKKADKQVRSSRPRTVERFLTTAAAVLAVAIVLTIAIPGTRRAVASWFGFPGISIQPAPSPTNTSPTSASPTSAPRTSPPPPPTTPAPLNAGRKATLAEAQRASQFRLRQPANLKPPDVFMRRDAAAVIVTLAYRKAPPLKPTPDTGYALIVTEIYDAGDPVLQKILQTGATAVPVLVDADRGVFLEGPQEIITLDHTRTLHGSPVVHEVAARASANTLIWGSPTTTYRLEGNFSQRAALALAESLR